MNKLLKYRVMIIFLLLFALISFGLFNLYEEHSSYHILVKFVKSGPLYKGMPVCFKGYEIGRTQKVTLSEDYKYTLVKIIIYPKNPKFPNDIEARVRKHDALGNYIDLVTSEDPSTTLLKNSDTITGRPIFDVGTFLSEIADSGLLIPLIQNFSDTALSLNKASKDIGNFFSDSTSILKDNRQDIKQTTKNLASTSKSFKKITSKFDSSITEDKLNNTTSSVNKSATNIQAASENIKNITQSVDCATRNLDKTVAKIDSTLSNANAVASNAKVITGGFCKVLGKRFAGLRIIFGKPLNKNNCCQNCSK